MSNSRPLYPNKARLVLTPQNFYLVGGRLDKFYNRLLHNISNGQFTTIAQIGPLYDHLVPPRGGLSLTAETITNQCKQAVSFYAK